MQKTADSPAARILTRISVEDFHRISELGIYDKRAELIRGVVFEKLPMSPLARISVEDFHRVSELGIYDKRAELIRGVVFQKPPMTPLHRKTSRRLHDHLNQLRLPGCLIWREDPLTLRDSEPIPDLAVIAGAEADFDHRHPSTAELVIEIAVSSAIEDREMAALYAEAGVKEYWIVLPEARQVEVYRRLESGVYRERQIFADEEEIVCAALPTVRVSLEALFA